MTPKLGLYEKALPEGLEWRERLSLAAELGYDFLEMAIDPSGERLARLEWSAEKRAELRHAIAHSGIPIFNVVLSAHRSYPFGSASSQTRQQALDITEKALQFAVDIGIRTIQLAGYFVFEEPHWEGARESFLEGLYKSAELASAAGVMLGLENMDGEDITSVKTAAAFVEEINSPWLKLYPDIGNLSAKGLDVVSELQMARGHLVGVHLKDTRAGEYRRVPFGEGNVPFVEAFRCLGEMDYAGPFAIEMWNDSVEDTAKVVKHAKAWIVEQMRKADFADIL